MTKSSPPAMHLLSDEEIEALDVDNLPELGSIEFNDPNDMPAEMREQLFLSMVEQTDDPTYMLALADLYLLELDRPQDAKLWLDKMLALDYLPAYITQAQMYMYGKYFDQDLDKAAQLFEQLIERYTQDDNIEQHSEQLAFCYLSLAQLYQAQEDIPQMLSQYFNALQLSSQEAASTMAHMFDPDITDDPACKAELSLLHCALLTLSNEFLLQQSEQTEDSELKQLLLSHYQMAAHELEQSDNACQLTSAQQEKINELIEAWNRGEPQVLMDAIVSYING
ncbi:hypothetical protein [Pragia fontium]|uniref:hypothetical protein n=1 Tax=Pragia fontium TaxID=82985 RepID=UPI0011C071FB|nr:hypothetical protein [Pragia fontium]